MAKNRLIIGTRGSRLALAQTALVADALKSKRPELVVEMKIIKTTGDINQSPIPLDTVGKSWFTGEIEQALAKGEIDFAVHSLKDMSLDAAVGLETIIVLERADPRDVLISKSGAKLDDLPQGAVVGTDSVRRKVLLLDRRPDLLVKSIRGNVDTRIKKLHGEFSEHEKGGKSEGSGNEEKYDALILAAAGLERLGMLNAATELFDPTLFLPASGQGTLAAQVRADRAELIELLHAIQHAPTRIAAEAELSFSRAMGGGCKMPVGCYALVEGDTISIYAIVGSLDGGEVMRKSATGRVAEAMSLVEGLAKSFPKVS